jgi:hypothetical protein
MVRRSLATFAVTAASVLLMQAPASADTTLADVTLPFALGGAQVCVVGSCAPAIDGITNVHFYAVMRGSGVTLPLLTAGTAPGCTANLNLAVFMTTLGIAGTVHTVVEFDRTDMNGNVIPGSHQVIAKDVSTTLANQSLPLASVCATLL